MSNCTASACCLSACVCSGMLQVRLDLHIAKLILALGYQIPRRFIAAQPAGTQAKADQSQTYLKLSCLAALSPVMSCPTHGECDAANPVELHANQCKRCNAHRNA